jgi:N-acetylmuramoyl-L-alanine amidase
MKKDHKGDAFVMPSVYLSPSTQEFNQLMGGGTEEYYLRASGIEFARNNPGDSVSRSIERSNERPYGLHLALHSTATPEDSEEPLRGIDVYHFAVSPVGGEIAAHLVANNLREIYPEPELVRIIPNYNMEELYQTEAPAVLVDLGYSDNPEDAMWIKDNIKKIGRNLALSVAQFLQVPFIEPEPSYRTPIYL